MLKLLAFLEPEALHDSRHPIGCAEIAHQIVFETDIEPRCARIALARATSTQLAIDSARLVALRPDHHQSTAFYNAGPKLNIGAAAGHVRCNRNRAWLPGTRHNLSLLHV